MTSFCNLNHYLLVKHNSFIKDEIDLADIRTRIGGSWLLRGDTMLYLASCTPNLCAFSASSKRISGIATFL